MAENHSLDENVTSNSEVDQYWADLLSPARRQFIFRSGLMAAGAGLSAGLLAAQVEAAEELRNGNEWFRRTGRASFRHFRLPMKARVRGDPHYEEPAARPKSVRPGEENGLPSAPRPYTDIKSYHAHFYFDEDTYAKAALVRKWSAERFPVELGNWNLAPRGPHVTPSFYFGFTNDLLPIIVPWLQLNSLGLTILLHPNTEDPRADHLYYTLWVQLLTTRQRLRHEEARPWPASASSGSFRTRSRQSSSKSNVPV